MSNGKRWASAPRGVALLVVGLLVGAMLITPAGAHVGDSVQHLWVQHIRPRVISLGDRRFVNTNEAAGGDVSGPFGNLQIGGGTVGSPEIANGTVQSADLALSSWTFNQVNVAANSSGTVFAACPGGMVALSGGASWDQVFPGTRILLTRPSFDGAGNATSWRVDGENATGLARQLVAFVLCIEM